MPDCQIDNRLIGNYESNDYADLLNFIFMSYQNTTESSFVGYHNMILLEGLVDVVKLTFQKIAKFLYYYGTTCGFRSVSVLDDIDDWKDELLYRKSMEAANLVT